MLLKVVRYMADASAESIRMSARSSALINSPRRALWLKTWSGDLASKVKLCGIPFTGDLLFGPELDRTADKKAGFPAQKKERSAKKRIFVLFYSPKRKKNKIKRDRGTPRGEEVEEACSLGLQNRW